MSQQAPLIGEATTILGVQVPSFVSNWLSTRKPEKSETSQFVKRAETEKLKDVFNKYASEEREGERFMTPKDFICGYLGIVPASANYNEGTVNLLANVVDTTNDGLISFVEFQAFEGCLCLPDSLFAVAFKIFDKNSNGCVNYDEFEDVLKRTELHKRIPFNFDSSFILLHFGKKKDKNVNYLEFTKLLHDFYEEHAQQAFLKFDEQKDGFIEAKHFKDIMLSLKSHLLTKLTRDNLIQIASGGDRSFAKKISYAYFSSFIKLLDNMELVKQIYISAARDDLEREITKEELLHEAQKFTQITPMEVDILFQLASIKNKTGKISFEDIRQLAPLDEEILPFHYQDQAIHDALVKDRGILMQMLESAYRFTLGSVAGATGATAVYPIDLVKTRLQNQRSSSYMGERLYLNSFDCFRKVFRFEGFLGLYRGLLPQIVGVAPEKAIKLTVNDLVRDKVSTPDGKIPLWGEILAGGSAGGCQVIFTNPLEIVKIRLQVAGEIASQKRLGAMDVVRELGFRGVYKGAPACLLRDIPFSAIFFPLYAHLKSWFANKDGYNSIPTLLISATIAGAPAAALVTPADVIKTRLQVVARKGQTTYNGIFDCAAKIMKEEGFKAFWKGAPARVFRSSPQFGVTLATYEILQRLFNVDFGGRQLAGSVKSKKHIEGAIKTPKNPDHIGGYRLAMAAFDGIETKFGICLPKFKSIPVSPAVVAIKS